MPAAWVGLLAVARRHRYRSHMRESEIDRGGRVLRVRDAGDPGGAVVVYFHGTPGSRLDLCFGEQLAAEHGVRLVTFDRPGYGGSIPAPFGLASIAADAHAITDELGIARFATLGLSGGGPGALAAALAPELAFAPLVILPSSPDGRDLGPRLAAAMGRPLIAQAQSVAVAVAVSAGPDQPKGGQAVVAEVARLDDRLLVPVTVDGSAVATLVPGARAVAPATGGAVLTELTLPGAGPALPGAGTGSPGEPELLALVEPDPATMDLADATRVLGGGAGLVAGRSDEQARATFGLLTAVSAALGASAGATRVGGFLGFSNRLDTALRGPLGDTVVMRVRADRPSYWIGETFDSWSGADWSQSPGSTPQRLDENAPFILPGPTSAPGVAQTDLQTFYVVEPSPNLVFHADSAHEVWFPTHDLFVSNNDSIVSPIGLGPGAIYTVESYVNTPTANQLRAAAGPDAVPTSIRGRDTEVPHPYPRVQALAEAVTAGETNTYDKVQSLISWMARHTRYSTDIPPLAPGQDTVDEFLFGNRTGFCEQISTALAVMLRSIGIPAREAAGYVPGSYNPITDLYDVQAKDAHAWVQVFFPGYGWQSFDPTAVVPLANPSPGSTLVHDVTRALGRLPWVQVALVLAVASMVALVVARRRRRPRTWAEKAARSIEMAGRRAGRPRRPGETLTEYATALDGLAGDRSGTWQALAGVVEASAYGGRHPTPEDDRQILATMRALRSELPRAGVLAGAGALRRGDGPARRRSSPPPRAGGDSPSAGGDG